MHRGRLALGLSLFLLPTASLDRPAAAQSGGDAPHCRVVNVDVNPTEKLQIVAWVEDPQGHFVDTIYITQLTGTYGLGNRPGIYDFNSGPRWPYGRRVNVFPVWAHRHGKTFPRLEFRDGLERNLSHRMSECSIDSFYCRPLLPTEGDWDALTCASARVFTDKGVLAPDGATSLYPPREDIGVVSGVDAPSVAMYEELNPFDAVSHATPAGNGPEVLTWRVPATVKDGDYVLWIEVSKEFDFNESYNARKYPAPAPIPYGDYGKPYRGQPSVVYRVPFNLGGEAEVTFTDAYVGYGDIAGADGKLRAPDSTIETAIPGSGASRLLLTADRDGTMYRVRVQERSEPDVVPPASVAEGAVVDVTDTAATVQFRAPGDDGLDGTASGYEIRYLAAVPMTESNFGEGTPTTVSARPSPAGSMQTVTVTGLLPETHYYLGVRAYDGCMNYGPLSVVEVTTEERRLGEVDACFVATAAYGSVLANDVDLLRRFRDMALRSTVLGELAVETYYTFGPVLAGVVAESDPLRAIAREALSPLVGWIRALTWTRR